MLSTKNTGIEKAYRVMAPQFGPLDKSRRQIRTLTLHPGEKSQTIACEHETVSLDNPGEYDALSYCWGSPENPHEIQLNGAPFHVSPSLGVALQYLRQLDRPRRLWIDAICINQTESDEKLHQVEQMRSIYESASRVLVWLGPPSATSGYAFDVMEKRAAVGEFTAETRFSYTHDDINSIVDLLQRPYWHRLWVVQEVAVSSKDLMLGCGARWLPWEALVLVMGSMYTLALDASFEMRSGVELAVNRYRELDKMRKQIQGTLPDIHSPSKAALTEKAKTNALELMNISVSRLATDPRDHIYALLGLMRSKSGKDSRLDHGLVPDYSKTYSHVFCEATKAIMETEKTLEILQFKNHLSSSGLPSWVPDFSIDWTRTFPKLGSDDDWRNQSVFQSIRGTDRISPDLKTLHACGNTVDTVELTIDLQGLDHDSRNALRIVHCAVFGTATNGLDPVDVSYTPTFRYAVDAIWRSLIGNMGIKNAKPAGDDYHDVYLTLVGRGPLDRPSPHFKGKKDFVFSKRMQHYIEAVKMAVRRTPESPHRRFMITKTGLIGLGTPDCQKGDSLCVFSGYKMPVVLRPCGEHYRFLGSAYVHGMMDGEGRPTAVLFVQEEVFVIE